MAFRERIEAVLKVKDLARFKGGMKSAADSVKDMRQSSEKNAAVLEVLQEVEKRLSHQTAVLAAQTEVLKHAQEEAAQAALEDAAAQEVLTRTVYRSRGGLRDSITRWSFWKDRLSLTRSEIMTTSLTLGAYLAPALIAVGNSAVAAALGGGAVAGAGLASFITGIGTLGIVANQMIGQVKKIQTAQNNYNIAVQQFGEGSKEAARQAARMYAVIQTQGGKPMLDAANALHKFGDAWREATGGARVNEAGIMTDTLNRMRQLLPMIGQEINMMSLSLRKALRGALGSLTGPEGQSTFKVLSNTFQEAIGPGTRGLSNVILVLSRFLRAAAPYAVKVAKAFERISFGWRRSTKDGVRVQQIIDNLVDHTKAWIGLGAELFRTLTIVFSSSKDRGGELIVQLTGIIKQFNDWLQAMKDAGAINSFFDRYIKSLKDLVWAVQNPTDAIRKWLPVIMDTVATAIATAGPHAAELFLDAFMNSGAWARFFTIVYLAKKFGIFRSLGKTIGEMFVAPFMKAFLEGFAAQFIVATAGEGAIAKGMATAGTAAGKMFGLAFKVAAVSAITLGLYEWAKKHPALSQYSGSKGWGELFKDIKNDATNLLHGKSKSKPGERTGGIGPIKGKAQGGVIPSGTLSLVGEKGPELAFAGIGGTQITPLSGGGVASGSGMQPMNIPPISVSDFVPPIHVSVQVEKREIASAVASYQDYRRARRGG